MKANPNLDTFLLPYDKPIRKLTIELRDFVTELVPFANELIWDNYNAVALAYSKSEKLKDAFCHIAVYSKHVNFGFNRGAELRETDLKLTGKGKLIRHVLVKAMKDFPRNAIEALLAEAVDLSETLNPDLIHKKDNGRSIVMSIAAKKIRPNKASV